MCICHLWSLYMTFVFLFLTWYSFVLFYHNFSNLLLLSILIHYSVSASPFSKLAARGKQPICKAKNGSKWLKHWKNDFNFYFVKRTNKRTNKLKVLVARRTQELLSHSLSISLSSSSIFSFFKTKQSSSSFRKQWMQTWQFLFEIRDSKIEEQMQNLKIFHSHIWLKQKYCR